MQHAGGYFRHSGLARGVQQARLCHCQLLLRLPARRDVEHDALDPNHCVVGIENRTAKDVKMEEHSVRSLEGLLTFERGAVAQDDRLFLLPSSRNIGIDKIHIRETDDLLQRFAHPGGG